VTSGATDALRADRDALLEICVALSDADWKTESGCAGWSVQDVVAHMGGLYWLMVDGSKLPDTSGLPTERAQDAVVESRRSWSTSQVVEDYASVSLQALEATAGLEQQDFELALGDLGTYQARLLPNAYAFDHFTHIRLDLFAPRGPLSGALPAIDEHRVTPTLDWIEAALPQQNAAVVAALDGTVELAVTGPGGRVVTVGEGPVIATVESDALSLVRWVTQRGSFDDGVTATGDQVAIDLIRTAKVF
jgi:uncharacterized protein (TIGR03083 family)